MTTTQPLYRIWTARMGQLVEHERPTLWTESEARSVLPPVPGVRFAFGTRGRGQSIREGWRVELVTDEAVLAVAHAERLAALPVDRMRRLAELLGSTVGGLERITLQLSAESFDAAYTSVCTAGHALARAGFAAEYGSPIRDDDGCFRATLRIRI
jgi:hypothetical protein